MEPHPSSPSTAAQSPAEGKIPAHPGLAGSPETHPYLNPNAPLEQRVKDLVARLTLEEKAILLNHKGPELKRFHILSDNWNQCLHGMRWAGGPTTLFPIPTGMAATWDPELIRLVADAISDEARAVNNWWHDDPDFKGGFGGRHGGEKTGLVYRSPVINIMRNPFWGRNGETWSEDPYLCGRMAVAFIKGLQGDDPRYLKLAATIKHFAVNNVEVDRKTLSANVSERMLREYWLPHWRDAVVEGGARSVMASYNQVNGLYNVFNPFLLKDILKGDWGFDGFTVSDLGGVRNKEMVVLSVNAGCDFSDEEFMKYIPEAVREGQISESRLDEALSRLLKVRFRLGEFDPVELVPWRKISMSVVCSPEHHALSLEASQKSIVLLKNDPALLPLDAGKLKKVAVLGPLAERVYEGDHFYIMAPGRKTVALLESLTKALPDAEILFAPGAEIARPLRVKDQPAPAPFDHVGELQKAVNAAKIADVAIVCVGTNQYVENEECDRTTLALPGNQQQLVEAVLAANPNTVVIFHNAGPLCTPWIKEHVPSCLAAWWSGEAQGDALADVLLGKANPAGRLPYTVYASDAQVPPQSEYDISQGFTYMYVRGEPLYAFGHGLSYTTFAYSDMKLPALTAKANDTIAVTLTLTNTGERDGDEVVQIYVKEPAGKVVKPRLRLVGFKRVTLKAGETQTVTIPVEVARMRYWDEDTHAFVAEPGRYVLNAGPSSADIKLSASFVLEPAWN